MLNEYQLMVLFLDDVRIFLIYALLVSGAYFYFTKKAFTSLHGLFIIAAFVYSVIISGFTERGAHQAYYWPLDILLMLALVSAIHSVRELAGKRWIHFVHIGTFVSAAFIWFVGGMAISHDWL